MKNLKHELSRLNNLSSTEDIKIAFDNIAKLLLGNCHIRKGANAYQILEIEFYFCNDNHPDRVVYPRTETEGRWFLHESGVDITFNSNEKQNFGGGILIRSIMNEDTKECIFGPRKCLWELFDNEALSPNTIYPYIEPKHTPSYSQQIKKRERYHVKGDFGAKEYRYYIAGILAKNYPASPWKNNTMIQDRNTNIVFLSKWLKTEDSDFFSRFTKLMDEMDIHWELLKYTNDIWARDYMPIQLGKNDFLKYKYWPNYLLEKKEDKKYITDCKRTCEALGITYRETDMIIDGGNMIPCGDYIVMTDKVFTENHVEKYDPSFIARLETELGRRVIIIPWHKTAGDVYGHADGFIKWCGGNKVLMSNHRDTDPKEAEEIKQKLEKHGFQVTEMLFNVAEPSPDWNWAYVNFIQIGNKILMPSFDIPEDEQAFNYVKDAFPNCEIRQIQMRNIADNGGALHCITWDVML